MRRKTIWTTVLAVISIGAATTAPTTTPVAVQWDEAVKHVGETATVTGPVMGTHVTSNKKSVTLNVGKDYPDDSRFSILLPYDEKAGDPDTLYKGKTVSVTGKIVLYKKVAETKANTVTVQK